MIDDDFQQPQQHYNNNNYDNEEELYAAVRTKDNQPDARTTHKSKGIQKKSDVQPKQLRSKVAKAMAPPTEFDRNVTFAPENSNTYHYPINNNNMVMADTPMAPVLTQAFVPEEKKKRKRRSRVKPQISYDIVNDVLEQTANIKVKELIAVNPSLKRQLMSACRHAASSLDPTRQMVQELNYSESTREDIDSTAVYSRFIIDNVEIKTLVDCGASKTCASKALMDSLGYRIDGPSNSVFTLGNGNKHASMGVIYDVPIKAAGIIIPCTVEVLAVMPIPLIIGTNWLHRANAIINFPKKIMTITYKRKSAVVLIDYISKKDIITPLSTQAKPIVAESSTEDSESSTDDSRSDSEESYSSESDEDSASNAELYMLEDDFVVDNVVKLTVANDEFKISTTNSKCVLPAMSQRTFFIDKPLETTSDLVYDFQLPASQSDNSLNRFNGMYDTKFVSLDHQFQISIINNSDKIQIIDENQNLGSIYWYDPSRDSAVGYEVLNMMDHKKIISGANDQNNKLLPISLDQVMSKIEIGELNDDLKIKFYNMVHQFQDIFDWDKNTIGRTNLIKHKIITEDVMPIRHRPYRLSPVESDYLEKEL